MRKDTPTIGEPDRFEVVVSLTIAVLGLLVFVGSFWIELGSGYDRIGPRFFPLVVAGGLLLSGVFLSRASLKPTHTRTDEPSFPTSRRGVALVGAALATSVVLLERLGFILTSALLFWLVARAFESDRRLRDAGVALLLSTTVYFVFTRGLGLNLPKGIFAGLF